MRLLLQKYEESSGQQINLQNSALYPGKSITRGRISQIQRHSGCQAKRLPFKYLAAPLYKGICRIQLFDDMIDKFAKRIKGWQSKSLSFGRKITLV